MTAGAPGLLIPTRPTPKVMDRHSQEYTGAVAASGGDVCVDDKQISPRLPEAAGALTRC